MSAPICIKEHYLMVGESQPILEDHQGLPCRRVVQRTEILFWALLQSGHDFYSKGSCSRSLVPSVEGFQDGGTNGQNGGIFERWSLVKAIRSLGVQPWEGFSVVLLGPVLVPTIKRANHTPESHWLPVLAHDPSLSHTLLPWWRPLPQGPHQSYAEAGIMV